MNAAIQSENPPARDTPKIEELRSAQELRPLFEEWSELWERSGQTPFQSPMWLVPWIEQFTGDNLVVLAIRHSARLIAVAPFYTWRANGKTKLILAGNG